MDLYWSQADLLLDSTRFVRGVLRKYQHHPRVFHKGEIKEHRLSAALEDLIIKP